mgnify:CR=1 FL=1
MFYTSTQLFMSKVIFTKPSHVSHGPFNRKFLELQEMECIEAGRVAMFVEYIAANQRGF